jgi:glycosyltransferase involved in cell wall biosynthesis
VKISVVVVVYNMRRAAPRTLLSLSPAYQHGVSAEDYEVIVVENGSSQPLDPAAVQALGSNYRYFFIEDASPSPAAAVNFGLRQASGELVGVLIDGARIVTPNLLQLARKVAATNARAVICTTGWSIGRDPQNYAISQGFNEAAEDALLESIRWPREPYRLFEISTLDGSSALLGPIAESNTLFMRRKVWDELEGMDERFDQPGGGFVNLDTLERAIAAPGSEMVLLLGEASFHQVHGGVSTNSLPHQLTSDLEQWHIHYQHIRQKDWRLPSPRITYYGTIHDPYRTQLVEWSNQQTLARVKFLRGELESLQAQAERANALADAAMVRAREAEAEADRRTADVEAARQREVEALHAELRQIRGSLAWRALGPLRWLRRRVGHGRGPSGAAP